MLSLADLWLPILVSALAVFIISMAFWTVSPHHKPDIKALDRGTEEKIMELVQSEKIKPGMYMYPHCGGDYKGYARSDEYKAKWESGCIGNLNIYPGVPSMGKNMALSFVVNIAVAVFVAYLAGLALSPTSEGMLVMRFTGAAAIGFYGFGGLMGAIWFGASLRSFITNGFDAVVYGLATGAVFMFLWPGVDAAANGVIPTT